MTASNSDTTPKAEVIALEPVQSACCGSATAASTSCCGDGKAVATVQNAEGVTVSACCGKPVQTEQKSSACCG